MINGLRPDFSQTTCSFLDTNVPVKSMNNLSQVPSARDSGGSPASPASHTYQKVPAEPWDCDVVPHLHVGSHLPEEHRPTHLVSRIEAQYPALLSEVIGSLKLGNVWVFIELIHRPTRTKS